MHKNKPIALVLAILLALITAVSATFAWFTSNDSAINHLETDQFTNGDVKIVEVFDPKDPLNPGMDVNKDVGAVNTGASGALLRISYAEVLRKLANNGKPSAVTTLWNGGTASIPQLFESKSIAAGGAYTAANGWSDITGAAQGLFDLTALNIPTDVTVLYKETVIGTKTTYQFVTYGTIGTHQSKYDGQLQRVSADFQYEKATKKVTVTNNDWNFWQFDLPANATKVKWADLGTFNDIDSNFVSKVGATLTLPRTEAQSDSNIELLFTSFVKTDLNQCSDGDWWYNQEDGYFYYIGKLGSGQATKTNLLDAVGLKATADSAYCNLNYDLIVKMESIQNVKEALKSTAGWKMGSTTATDNLIAKLTGLGAFA